MKLVTIAIPFYNAETYLAETINSVLAQTFSEFDLLLIDDGSKDKSLSIAKEFELKDARVKVFSDGENKNLGFRLNQIPTL
ncbi:MAG: glycosyltransferase family 2 protein, partial [Bacteroidetes bacterium]|nr:glycosyltransferase family 2 protein [Bacteroidota bacterium]